MKFLWASLTLLVCSPALSQNLGTGTRLEGPKVRSDVGTNADIFRTYDRKTAVQGAITLKRIGECLIHNDRSQVRLLLSTIPESVTESRVLHAMYSRIQQCMTIGEPAIATQGSELRGAISEALYVNDYPQGLTFEGSLKAVSLPSDWMSAKLNANERGALANQEFADCVVLQKAADVSSLVHTVPRSRDEAEIIRHIAPALGPCLPNGLQMSVDAASLRALLAEALYRSAAAWRQPTAVAGG